MRLVDLLVRLRGPLAIKDPEVATLLRLTDTQQIRIRNATRWNLATLRDRIRSLRQSGGGVRPLRESLRELHREAEQSVVALLTEDQRQRLERISQRVQDSPANDARQPTVR
jgi:hypothetical protein